MKVTNVMSLRPLTIGPSDTIQQAEKIMHENDIRQLPVIKGKELVGIITDRDIRSFLGGLGTLGEEKAMGTKVASVMTTKPITLCPEDDLRDATELLIEQKVGGIPVVDEEVGLLGIITYVDLLRCLLERLDEEG